PGAPAWLGITGTNGKTTTTTMLAAILRAAGLRTAALGNIGEPLVFAANGDFDVLGVVDGRLVDRAFVDGAHGDGVDLGPADGIRPTGAHNVSNALHAAALARA